MPQPGRAEADEITEIAAFISRQQQLAHRRIPYLSEEPEAIITELSELDDWQAHCHVLRDGSGISGFLAADIDRDMGRVWWWGPFAGAESWMEGAEALYAAARHHLAQAHVTEEELAGTSEHADLASFAARNGFLAEEESVALECRRPTPGASGLTRPMSAEDRAEVELLHDALFPGTHTPGAALVADHPRRSILVTAVGGALAGYVAVEAQADGSGYVDFVGVATEHRGRGLGAALVGDATSGLFETGATYVHLTVRAGNTSARRLYRSLGFEEAFILVPYRRGFTPGS
jgi:ribosomal protein S18 acetylase RimI-like enzyme